MDTLTKLEQYRQILRQLVTRYAGLLPHKEQVETLPLCDTEHDNYMLMRVGWDKTGRAHWTVFHLRLKDGKVWIEDDSLEHGIAQDLLDAGIPKQDIVLSFHRPERRHLMDFAVT